MEDIGRMGGGLGFGASEKEGNHGDTEARRGPWNFNSMNIDGQDEQDGN
jgi:hypothetical protein